ncbi:MATE family efflux transporter [Colwellia hornerae]|uniref:MATE family efflux transporter n=1 Tax=Colwellia hornerae TaxID=89402 RepID=A0A5C6QRY6_9GAMM|nr:MATE family efflux transporter [Colwellia hornerae]TWX57592.1 MATE family efflux transporter [Colwellia hornerae]TWX62677.1 MATE family efflux transporter [Colwellia hornerae]TWX71587.1 MATE family efflux transporter [Colwellia hornerae]
MTEINKKKKINLLEDPVAETIKQMTIPMIYGMVLLMTFNLVDTFFVGLLGTQPLAAISFTFPITFTVISLTIGLGIGTSAVIAKALGKGNDDSAKNSGTAAIYLATIIVGIISCLGFYFIDETFLLLGANESLLPLIHQYMDIWFIGSICLIGPMIGNAILRASGDTKTPSIIMGSAGLINAILDPILIFGFGPIPAMGIQGAAIATLISWIFGCLLVLYIVGIKRELIHTKLLPLKTFIASSKGILHIGLPAAGANMLTPIAAAILTAIVANYGESAVAAFGVGSRIESIACLVVLAMSMTLPPFISQNFGAGNMHRVEKSYKVSIKFILVLQLFIYLLLVLIAPFIADVFSKEQAVADTIVLFIWILPLGYGFQGVIILTNSSFNALHKPLVALVLSAIRLFVCYVPLAYLGSIYYGIEGFFIGGVFGNLIMAMISFRLFDKQFPHELTQVKDVS